MRIVSLPGIARRGGFGPLAGFFVLLLVASLPSIAPAGQDVPIKLLYFFSSTCRHCTEVKPTVIDLSKEFPLEGLHFGQGPVPALPFPVKEGDKKTAKEIYGISRVPS